MGVPAFSFTGGGGLSAAPVDVSCARTRVDTDAKDTTDVACASNRASVRDAEGWSRFSQAFCMHSFIPQRRLYVMGAAFVR